MHSIIIPKSALKPCILTACAVHMHQHSGNGRFILWLQTTMDAGLVLCPVGHTGRSAARRFARATDPRRSIHADAFVVRSRRVSHTGIASPRPCRTPPSTLNGYMVFCMVQSFIPLMLAAWMERHQCFHGLMKRRQASFFDFIRCSSVPSILIRKGAGGPLLLPAVKSLV